MDEWALNAGVKAGVDGVSLLEFQALTRSLLLPRSVSGDISHHLGIVNRRQLPCGRDLELELLPNPSHLEAVNPLVSGRARAIQLRLGRDLRRKESDSTSDALVGGSALTLARRRCVPLAVHGDAAFAAQGVVYETLGLSQLEGYSCGGTVHIIINNQIGFTTPPGQARSSRYCSDVAKVVEAPIFHVNGDDVEAVVRVCRLAVDFRQRFGRDVVVDLVCYRKNGHQENDNPAFTQPAMCAKIAAQQSTFAQYAGALVTQGAVTSAQIDEVRRSVTEVLADALDLAKESAPASAPAASTSTVTTSSATSSATSSSASVSSSTSPFAAPPPTPPPNRAEDEVGEEATMRDDATGVPLPMLLAAGKACTSLPDGLHAHRVVRRIYEQRPNPNPNPNPNPYP